MPPKASKSKDVSTSDNDDIAEIKSSLADIHNKLNEICKLRKDFDKLWKTMQKIQVLKQKVEDFEQYSRINDVVISGLKTSHKTYARAVNTNGEDHQDAPETETHTLENQVMTFLKNQLAVDIEENEVEACHTLRGNKEVLDLIIRVTNRKTKTKLLRNANKLRGTRVFMNEHLTRKNPALARMARQFQKSGNILNTWTRNCKVFVKMRTGQVNIIKGIEDFRNLGLNPT